MTHAIQAYAPNTLDDIQRTAKLLAVSGYTDAKGPADVQIAQLATKIMAGAEMGYPPFASVQGIHVIQGKPTIGANLMAAAVKAHPHYDYRVKRMDNDGVEIEFFQLDGKRESLGVESFTMDDAKAAGLTGKDNWRKFPRNMLFARCMSNGVRFRCPDVFNGNAVYVPEELGAEVDGEGNVIDVEYRAEPSSMINNVATNGDMTEDDLPDSLDDVDEDSALAVDLEALKNDARRHPAWATAHKRFMAVGSEAYGPNWHTVRHVHVLPSYNVESSNDMTVRQLKEASGKMQAVIDRKKAAADAELPEVVSPDEYHSEIEPT